MTIHEIEDTVNRRIHAIYRSRGVKPIGLVLSQDYYKELVTHSDMPWKGLLIKSEYRIYERKGPQPGDSFLGLDVAITKAEDTIIVY